MIEYAQKYLTLTLSWLLIYFSPTADFILTVGFFVFADTVTGAFAANRAGEFSSKELRRVLPKYIVYGVAVLVSYVIQQQFFTDFPAMKLVSGLIAYGELVSIDENIKKMTGKSLFKFFIKKFR